MISPKLGGGLDKVCDLFYPNTKVWNVELLDTSFYPWEADVIKRIYVSSLCHEDCLVWPWSPDGSYTVKSAYHMLANEALNSSPSSSNGMSKKIWNGIWKIKAPQKIRHFIWRAAKDSLPSRQNLVRWQIKVDETCSLCNEHQESILHALWLSDQAKAVWKSVLCFARFYQRNFRLVMDLVEAIMEQGSAFTVALFSSIAWSLWERRNRIRENQPSWPLHEIGNKAKELVLEFFDVHKQVPSSTPRIPQVRWSPPPVGFYKANFDAALFEESNFAGIGVVFRDCSGEVIGALSQNILLPKSVKHAEALAAS